MDFLFINWNPDVVALDLGFIAIRWYSLCWVLGLVSVYLLMHKLFREQNLTDEQFDPMFMYCFVGILVGARLGHCLFYEPEYYLFRPMEMILPARNIPGLGWKYTGYEGLASHGGTIGLMIAVVLYAKHQKINLMRVLDNVAIVTPICACAIRLGNLMNSEIIGRPTDVPWAFIFHHVDELPRHPGQLYEAICYALFFWVGWFIYRMSRRAQEGNDSVSLPPHFRLRDESRGGGLGRGSWPQVGSGFYFGLCIFLIFLSRIFIEYTKENQVSFEQGMWWNMGQLLSIPFVLLGLYCMMGGKWCRRFAEK